MTVPKHSDSELERDEWGRAIVYSAKWGNIVGASSSCLFSEEDAAIFFVVSGLGADVDWAGFPDPSRSYPHEERNGSERLNPVFRVQRGTVYGEVSRLPVAEEWVVGNGIALAAKEMFKIATGRDAVRLSGEGDKLQGRVGKARGSHE